MELKPIFFSGLVIFNNYRMFTFLVSNSDVDYRLVEKYFPNCCWTTPIGKLARATRYRILTAVRIVHSQNRRNSKSLSFPHFPSSEFLNQLAATPSLELAMRSSGSLAGVTSPGVLHARALRTPECNRFYQ